MRKTLPLFQSLFVAFMLLANTAIGAITINSTASTNGEASSFTYALTVNAGSDRILLISVAVRTSDATIISGVTFDGVAVMEISQTNYGGVMTHGYFRVADPTVTTANVVVTLTGSEKCATGSLVYDGVSGVGASATNDSSGVSITNNLTTTQANSMIVNIVLHRMSSTFTKDSNFTDRFSEVTTGNPANSNLRNIGQDRLVTTATNYSHTHTLGSFVVWVDLMQELLEQTGATGLGIGTRSLLGVGK